MKIEIKSLNEIDEAAKEFVSAMGERTVFAFYGDMGAGKTFPSSMSMKGRVWTLCFILIFTASESWMKSMTWVMRNTFIAVGYVL